MPKKKQLTLMTRTRRRHKRGQFDLCLYLYLDRVLDPVLDLNTTLHPFRYEEKVGNLALLLERQGLEKSLSLFCFSLVVKKFKWFLQKGFQEFQKVFSKSFNIFTSFQKGFQVQVKGFKIFKILQKGFQNFKKFKSFKSFKSFSKLTS